MTSVRSAPQRVQVKVRVLRCGHRHAPGVPAVTQRVRPGIAVGITAGRAGVQRVALLRARRRDDRGNIGVLMLLFRDLGVFTAPVAAEALLMLQAGLLLRRLTVDDPDEFMRLECLVRLPAIAAGAAVALRRGLHTVVNVLAHIERRKADRGRIGRARRAVTVLIEHMGIGDLSSVSGSVGHCTSFVTSVLTPLCQTAVTCIPAASNVWPAW